MDLVEQTCEGKNKFKARSVIACLGNIYNSRPHSVHIKLRLYQLKWYGEETWLEG
jgi:hypothetical protein